MDKVEGLPKVYTIKIGEFEGPLDLLFHLIEENKVSIYEIPISEITDQYMDYLFSMQKLDLDIASEFFLMAAILLHIKSRMLLPSIKNENKEDEGNDPRDELKRKLLEYKKYKEVANLLKGMEKQWDLVYYKMPEPYNLGTPNSVIMDMLPLSIHILTDAYTDLLKKNKDRVNRRVNEIEQIIERDKVSIKAKMRQLQNILTNRGSFVFSEIFFYQRKTLTEIVTAFVALLVLVKVGRASVEQKKQFSDIFVKDKRVSKAKSKGLRKGSS